MASEKKTRKCSLFRCHNGKSRFISWDMARVEVQTTLPASHKTVKSKHQLVVDWGKKGEACFHDNCWQVVLKSARARSQKNILLKHMKEYEKKLIKEASKTSERHDKESVFKEEAVRISKLIKSAKHCVCFTGAGISTAAGIGDYRGKSGKWTEEDRDARRDGFDEQEEEAGPSHAKRRKMDDPEGDTQDESDEEDEVEEEDEEVEEDGVPYESLRPTYTHEALYKLMQEGYLKYCISQNGDGLHGLSGIPQDKLSELHGNVFIEVCDTCKQRYERPYYVMDDVGSQYYEEMEDYGKSSVKKPRHAVKCDRCGLSHRTGRRCEQKGCKGYLNDSIINFRDLLESEIMDRAWRHAESCDLMLCLGTTLTVTPANELVKVGKPPLRLIICNRQKTHLDEQAVAREYCTKQQLGSRVFGDCDRLFRLVMPLVLGEKHCIEWEAGKDRRREEYDKLRVTNK